MDNSFVTKESAIVINDPFTNEFFSWLDRTNLNRQDVASELGNSVKTISSWRSIGIPMGKRYACQAFMEHHQKQISEQIRHEEQPNVTFKETKFVEIPNRIVMHPSRSQLHLWNVAALQSGLTLEEWALKKLEEIAKEHYLSSHCAENPSEYKND